MKQQSKLYTMQRGYAKRTFIENPYTWVAHIGDGLPHLYAVDVSCSFINFKFP